MGQQQLLLIILGVIIVGIAIAVGLSLFTAQSIQSNKDAIINDINNIAASAYQFRIRPTSMGGAGGATYAGFSIPVKMSSNENATYSAGTGTAANITIIGGNAVSTDNTVTAVVGSDGRVTMNSSSFGGEFK
ncbi:MAG: hypothetical protein EHM64_07045 [Ignavibacteriae bacterium]|nr:MAG: hypothetical protein EHM64_07045 [Ignavibacteriota bacterium]